MDSRPSSHGTFFRAPNFKVHPNATSLPASRDVPGDATRYMICFVSYELKISSDPGGCANSSHAMQHSQATPLQQLPCRYHRHLAYGPVILGPVAWLRLEPLRDGPMVEASQVAFRNKRHRRPLFHVLFDTHSPEKDKIKDQAWSARRQLKAVATMSLIGLSGGR